MEATLEDVVFARRESPSSASSLSSLAMTEVSDVGESTVGETAVNRGEGGVQEVAAFFMHLSTSSMLGRSRGSDFQQSFNTSHTASVNPPIPSGP